jgi:hypothetical protein
MLATVENMPRGRANDFDSCIRHCTACGVGASNALNAEAVTFIHQDPLMNIPQEARVGALETLKAALNIRSRDKKRSRFGFSSSEDAVTWVVFDYLRRSKQLVPVLEQLELASRDNLESHPALLLWGVPIGPSDHGDAVRDRLVKECIALGERRRSLSEPDVIIDLGEQGIVFIEVKYRSGNDFRPSAYPNWVKYDSAERPLWKFDDVMASGCYELARYWRLLERLADGRRGILVNLGLPALFGGAEGERLDRFVQALCQSDSLQFMKVTWGELLAPALPGAERWFVNFCCSDRKLVGRR